MNNELYHYGVKGMKWGHRKPALETSTTRSKPSKTTPSVGTRQSSPKNKPIKTSSNNTKPKQSVKTGKKKADRALSEIGNKSLKAVGKTAKTGMSVAQSLYNISDYASERRQTAFYLNTATQMSPDYLRRFAY